MSEIAAETSDGEPDIRRLTFDLDVEVCVVGGGLAGLSVALEAAKMGASVAVLEGRRIGWSASGHHLGTVTPGFDVAAQTIIERIGRKAAGDLWRMSQTGAEIVRVLASDMPGIAMRDGALDVSASARGDRMLGEMQALGADFGIDSEFWDTERLRGMLDTKAYFGALHHPRAFQIDGAAYLLGLAAAARNAGVRIFEKTPVVTMDVTGARKRIETPSARLRASHLVLAGNVHLGTALPRLSATLLPVWRYGGITAPLGDQIAQAIAFGGSVADSDGVDHFRLLDGERLMWSSAETTWQTPPHRFESALQRRIRRIFPQLGPIGIAETFSGGVGTTVHGMPQIGQLRPGLWIASGFGRKGLNTTAMAGRIIARGILYNDDRWRLFGPFDLIWAGGRTGLVAGYAIGQAARGRAAVLSALARRKEKAGIQANMQARLREARIAAVSARANVPQPAKTPELEGEPQVVSVRATMPPSPFLDVAVVEAPRSQESEHENRVPT